MNSELGLINVEAANSGLLLFSARRYAEFDEWLERLAIADRPRVIADLLQQAQLVKDEDFARVLARRIAQRPDYRAYFQVMPTKWEQSIIFTQFPFLKTRVNLSYFKLHDDEDPEVDYTLLIMNQQGHPIFERHDTIHAWQTHSFELEDLLVERPDAYGQCCIQTAGRDLHSLRLYAQWYNDVSLTTTHEKKAYANRLNPVVFPVVLCDSQHDTYLAISNLTDEPISFKGQLVNAAQQEYSALHEFQLGPKASLFCPLRTVFGNLEAFLEGQSGVYFLGRDRGDASFYYFTHHKESGAWQVQHA